MTVDVASAVVFFFFKKKEAQKRGNFLRIAFPPVFLFQTRVKMYEMSYWYAELPKWNGYQELTFVCVCASFQEAIGRTHLLGYNGCS